MVKRRKTTRTAKRSSTGSNLLGRSMSFWFDASQMMMGSGEVITRRMDMMGRSMRGEAPFDVAEFTRMWHEKFVAGISLAFSLNQSALGSLPVFFPTAKGATDASALLDSQLKGLTSALRPYRKAVEANRKRLRGK
ncbi:MAG: hypothetical protein PSY14_06500 [bacterium]|nr:hypothetical protein [bacterium]